jgi:TPR repeat protein
MRRILTGLVLILMLTGGAAADPYSDALDAYNRGDNKTAARLLRPLAQQGNAFAQGTLASIYASGDGILQNYAEAVKWYRLSAEQGDDL